MSGEVAALGIRASTEGVKQAVDQLKDLAEAAGKAEGATDKLAPTTRKAGIGAQEMGGHAGRAAVATSRLGSESRTTEGALARLAGVSGVSVTGALHRMAAAAGIVVGTILSMQTIMAGIGSARRFDAALAETSTLLAGNAEQMRIVEDGARSMAREFGGSAASQVKAYYQAISAGAGDAAAATKLLDTANRLAVGGLVDAATAVDVLTTATNAYKASGLTAADASDALFVGMRLGKTTITELSSAVGGVLPLAVSLGVSFDETVAAMAALTTQGIATSQAATGVRAALTSMIAPSDEAQKLAAKLGIEFSAAGVQARGFGGVMDQIIAKTGGNTAQIQQLFGSVEATTAALSFAGGAGTVYANIMEEMAVKTGATSEAFGLMADSLDQRLNIVMAQGQDLLLAFGNVLLSGLVPALEAGVSMFGFIAENMDALAVITAGLAATQIPALVIALGAKAAAMYAAATAAGVATGAMTALNAAVAFLGGPIAVAAGVAVAALGAAYLVVRNNAEPARGFVDDLNVKFGQVPGFADAADAASRRAAAGFAAAGGAASEAASKIAALNAEYAKATGFDPWAYSGDAFQLEPIIVPGSGAGEIDGYLGGLSPVAPSSPAGSLVPSAGGGRGGGGGGSDRSTRLEGLVSELQTERELLTSWYSQKLELINSFNEQELEAIGGHKGAIERLEAEHLARQRDLADQGRAHEIAAQSSMFSTLAGFLSSFGDRSRALQIAALAINTGIRIRETLQNAAAASVRALAELGPIAGPPAAAKIMAYGKVQSALIAAQGVASAAGGGGSGRGGGGGGSSAAASQASAPAPQSVTLDFSSADPSIRAMAQALMPEVVRQLQGLSKNGVRIERVVA